MKRGLPIILIATFICCNTALAAVGSFSDVPSDNPYYLPIENLKSLGIISGYSDGTFKPDQLVNRAEALKIVMVASGNTVEKGFFATGFKDVPLDAWYASYVMKATILGYINGNPDGTFAPVRNVNKAEFVKMSLNTFNVTAIKAVTDPPAADVGVLDWYAPYLSYAKNIGIIFPNLQNQLQPGKYLSRAECAEIIYEMYVLTNGGETQKMLNIVESKLVDALVQINNNNLQNAIDDSNQAVFYSESALHQAPDAGIAKAANNIAMGFQKLFLAYQAALKKADVQMKSLLDEAKNYAQQAVQNDNSVQNLADGITLLSDQLIKGAP